MRSESFYPSRGKGKIHACRWTPEGEIKAVVQIVHGIAEYAARYDDFARYLNRQGILVVAADHMGHGQSLGSEGKLGYFHGGWAAAVEDIRRLMMDTMAEFPKVPYVLFGHSMGSFLTRTLLAKYPECGIAAAVICGTGWQPEGVLKMGLSACEMVCRRSGEENPSEKLQGLVFGSYNRRVEHPRTPDDWLSRDAKVVDAYIADPLCGFTVSAGLLRDMLGGIAYVQRRENLARMRMDLPVLFIAGGDDPVGSYGRGVARAARAFREAGMAQVDEKIYPLCRHEILNEINREDIYRDVTGWILKTIDN